MGRAGLDLTANCAPSIVHILLCLLFVLKKKNHALKQMRCEHLAMYPLNDREGSGWHCYTRQQQHSLKAHAGNLRKVLRNIALHCCCCMLLVGPRLNGNPSVRHESSSVGSEQRCNKRGTWHNSDWRSFRLCLLGLGRLSLCTASAAATRTHTA